MRDLRSAATFLCLGVLLHGCGGGGGGGAGGLSITPTSLTFAMKAGDPLPPPQSIQLTITNSEAVYAGFGYVPSQPSWLSADLVISGSDVSVQVQVTSALPPGTYQATLRIGIARADQSILATQDAAVTVTVADVLTASPGTLGFEHVVGATAPSAKDVAVGGGGLAWTAAADQGWIHVAPASGTSPSTLTVSVDTAGLGAGSYAGSVTLSRVGTSEQATIGVSLAVAAPAVQASEASLSFTAVNGSAIASRTVDVTLTNGVTESWTAAAGDPWVVLEPTGGTTPGTLTVSVDPSRGTLASGVHASAITLTSSFGGATLTTDLPVELVLAPPTLSVNPASVTIGGPLGRDLSAVQVQLGLGAAPLAPLAWTAEASDPWIAPGTTSGTVGVATTDVAVHADVAGMAPGTHAGSLTFTVVVNGDVVSATLPVTLQLDARRLISSDDGVAFAVTGAGSRLTRTLTVRDSFGSDGTWTASADRAWLTVSPVGTAPGEITLQADPTGLAADALHEGTVTIVSDDPAVGGETIRVGLWNGTAGEGTRTVVGAFERVEMDPIRPYAYVHTNGADVTVYNVYTGAVVTTFAGVAPVLGALTVSTDGAYLYAEDATNHRVVPIELPGGTPGAAWPIANYGIATLAYSRTNGEPLVFAGYGCAYHASTGAPVDATPMYSWCSMLSATSVAGNRICATQTNASPHDVLCRSLDYTAAQDRVVPGSQVQTSTQGYRGDIAIDPTGARVYVGQGYSGAYDAATMALLQSYVGQRNFEPTRDGRVVAGSNATYPAPDLTVLDADGFALASYRVAGSGGWMVDGQMKVTGEGICVAAITEDSKLVFLTIGP